MTLFPSLKIEYNTLGLKAIVSSEKKRCKEDAKWKPVVSMIMGLCRPSPV